MRITPASGFSAPARIPISVLFPAPFWPTSAHTSPDATATSTPSSATVAPNALRTPRISKRAESFELNRVLLTASLQAPRVAIRAPRPLSLLQPSLQIGMQQLFRIDVVHAVARYQAHAGVNPRGHLVALDVRDDRLDALVTHVDRVLQHEAVDGAVGHTFDERVGRIEADELHPARPAVVLKDAHHRQRRRLVRREDAIDVHRPIRPLHSAQQSLALLVRALDIGAAVLIRADDLNLRTGLDRFEESLLALIRAVGSFRVAKQDDLAFGAEQFREMLTGECAAPAIVRRHIADVVSALEAGV